MSIECTCPECSHTYDVDEEVFGKSILCPKCQARFTVAIPVEESVPKPARRQGAAALWPVLRIIVWVFTAVLLMFCAAFGAAMLNRTQNAIQEASISALAAAAMVCIYALARACTAILDDLEKAGEGIMMRPAGHYTRLHPF